MFLRLRPRLIVVIIGEKVIKVCKNGLFSRLSRLIHRLIVIVIVRDKTPIDVCKKGLL